MVRLEAMASGRLEAIASRVEAIAIMLFFRASISPSQVFSVSESLRSVGGPMAPLGRLLVELSAPAPAARSTGKK